MIRPIVLIAVAGALAACGDASTAAPFFPSSPPPTQDVIRGWETHFCQAQPGVTRTALFTAMGQPTSTYPSGAAAPEQATWAAYEVDLVAYFTAAGQAWQLQVNAGRPGCTTRSDEGLVSPGRTAWPRAR